MNNENQIINAVGDLAKVKPSTDSTQDKRYEVTLHHTDYRYMRIEVFASSPDDAERIAEEIAANQEEDAWQVADRDLYAYATETIGEGASND